MRIFLYNLLFPPAMVLLLPFYLVKQIRRGGLTRAYAERFGHIGREQREALRALRHPIWIHAVSVGEVVAALTLISRWHERKPDREFVLTTTTTTGHALAAKRLSSDVPLLYAPVDFFPWVRRALSLVQPSMLLLLEVEIWPNLIARAARQNVPIVLANGRVSERSAARYARHRWFFRNVFEKISLFCVQTDTDAARIRSVCGLANIPVHVRGTMKFDQVSDPHANDRRQLLQTLFPAADLRVFTAGSTHPGEEECVLDAFAKLREEFPGVHMVLAPRHHERTGEIESILRQRTIPYRKYTDVLSQGASPPAGEDVDAKVLLLDTTGELMSFYAASDIVFVGKSLAGNKGGHNIIEPALFAKPVLHGPNMDNFRTVSHLFRKDNATLQVETGEDIRRTIAHLLSNPHAARSLGDRAHAVVEKHRGATDRTINDCEHLFDALAKGGG